MRATKQLPEHLHAAYNWVEAAGEINELAGLCGADRARYCREAAANFEAGWEEGAGWDEHAVTEADLVELAAWLRVSVSVRKNGDAEDELRVATATALSQGFSAGNFGNAYHSEDLMTAWGLLRDETPSTRAEWDIGDEPDPERPFDAGYVLGFFGSYETHEVPSEHRDLLGNAHGLWAAVATAAGIAVPERTEEEFAL